MTNSDVFFNLLSQVLFEATGSAANTLKNHVSWPTGAIVSTDKQALTVLLKRAATDETIYGAWWNSDATV